MADDKLSSIFSPEIKEDLKELRTLPADLKAVTDAIKLLNAESSKTGSQKPTTLKETKDFTNSLLETEKKRLTLTFQLTHAMSEQAKQEAILQAQLGQQNKINRDLAKSLVEVTSEYKKLENQHKALEANARELYILFGKNSQQFRDAAAAANTVGTKLKDIDASLGRFNRNVGNYASGFSGISQVLREIPNAANNLQTFFLAISNNLVQVGDDITRFKKINEELIAQGKATIPVWKQIGNAILSPQTAIILFSSALILYGKDVINFLTGTTKATKEAQDATKEFEDSIKGYEKTAQQSAAAEISRLRVLESVATDTNASMEKRQHAVDEMQRIYPTYLANIKDEAILSGQAADQIDRLTNAILAKAVSEAASQKYAAAYFKELEIRNALKKATEEQEKAQERLTKAQAESSIQAEQGTSDIIGASTAARRANNAVKDLTKSLTDATTETQGFAQAAKDAMVGVDDLLVRPVKEKKVKVLKDEFAGLREEIAKLSLMFRNGNLTEDLNNLLSEFSGIGSQDIILGANIKLNADTTKTAVDALTSELNKQLIGVENSYQAGLYKTFADYEKAKLDTQTEYAQKRYKVELEGLRKQLLLVGPEKRTEINAQINTVELKAAEELSKIKENSDKKQDDSDKKKADNIKKRNKELADVIKNIYNDLASVVSTVINNIYQDQLNGLSARQVKLERLAQSELNIINASAISAEEKERRVRDAEAQTAKERAKLDKERIEIQRRQAAFNKAISIAQIIVNTAQAVTAALTAGPFAGPVFAAITAAIGAAQLAVALAAPLPAYKHGTDNHPGGPALIGEGGESELVQEKGRMWVANRPMIVDLAPGARVIPESKLTAGQYAMLPPGMVMQMEHHKQGPVINEKSLAREIGKRVSHETKVNVNIGDQLWYLRHMKGKR